MIERGSLLSLEAYARERASFRAKVIEHKKHRSVALGDHVTLLFEDELTIRYQVQEMLRIERIFEEEGIRDELDTYNPLIPDGANWKATMLIEYPDAGERQRRLAQLKGIEDRTWVEVQNQPRVFAIASWIVWSVALSSSAAASCSLLKIGSPKPIIRSRSAEPAGIWRSVRSAAADGTMVTAWVRASHGTPR